MASELIETLQTAHASGSDPALAAFRLVASDNVLRSAWLLSIAIDVTKDDLAELFERVWPEIEQDPIREAIAQVETWPFVRLTKDRLNVGLGMSPKLAADFAALEPEAFLVAHEALVQFEELREIRDDPYETWAARGRIAFYLAGVRPNDSVAELGAVFASAPPVDRTSARIWVSSLALRQEPLLGDQTRELSFYRGFRAYVMGDRTAARREFEAVVAEVGDDVYRAIALHLLGVIIRNIDPERGINLLKESVDLSEQLGIRDNELMARASLATAHMARAQEAMEDPTAQVAVTDLETARQLASEGLRLAQQTDEDETLVSGLRQIAVVTEWLSITQNRRNISLAAKHAVPRLDEELATVMESSVRRGDYEQFLLAGNSAAGMFADINEVGAALSRLERVVDRLDSMAYPPARIVRLQQTGRRVLSRARNDDDRQRAYDLLERLEQLTTRLPTGAQRALPFSDEP